MEIDQPPHIELTAIKHTPAQRTETHTKFKEAYTNQLDHFLGYQADQQPNVAEETKHLLGNSANNIGDPWAKGGFSVNTKHFERALLSRVAKLWGNNVEYEPPTKHTKPDPEAYWGYVLSMGSTEGNVYGMWQARDFLQGKILLRPTEVLHQKLLARFASHTQPTIAHLPYAYRQVKGTLERPPNEPVNENWNIPIAFISEDAHYSLIKFCRVLEINTFHEYGAEHYATENPFRGEWPDAVPTKLTGEVVVEDLITLVKFFAGKGHPVLIIANYGSVFRGAYDNVQEIGKELQKLVDAGILPKRTIKHGDITDIRDSYWLHVDGALGASYAPFLRQAHELGEYHGDVPPAFDFSVPQVHSINTSGHKWPGTPWPSGVFLTKVKYQMAPPSDPIYISSPDTTFAGSRNGFSATLLWDFFSKNGDAECRKLIVDGLERITAVTKRLKELSEHLYPEKKDALWVQHSPAALCVIFRRPIPEIIFKYSLSCTSLIYEVGTTRDYAHVFAMNHTTHDKFNAFVDDLWFWKKNHDGQEPFDLANTVHRLDLTPREAPFSFPFGYGQSF